MIGILYHIWWNLKHKKLFFLGKDSCNGDSGGPLVYRRDNKADEPWFQVKFKFTNIYFWLLTLFWTERLFWFCLFMVYLCHQFLSISYWSNKKKSVQLTSNKCLSRPRWSSGLNRQILRLWMSYAVRISARSIFFS